MIEYVNSLAANTFLHLFLDSFLIAFVSKEIMLISQLKRRWLLQMNSMGFFFSVLPLKNLSAVVKS